MPKEKKAKFRLDVDVLRKEAEVVLQEVARDSRIYVTRGVINAVHEIVKRRYPIILSVHESGRLDLITWRRHVKRVGAAVADSMKRDNIFYVHTPRRFTKLALPVIEKYEYEDMSKES